MPRVIRLAVLILGVLCSSSAFADEPGANSSATPDQVHQAVDRSLKYLRSQSAEWLSTKKCAACHHAAFPLWAMNEAERHGYAIDKQFVVETFDNILGSREKMIAAKLLPEPGTTPDTRPGLNMGTLFMAFAARSLPTLSEGQKQSLTSIPADIIKKQESDGSWKSVDDRTPIHEGPSIDTSWCVLVLENETGPDAPQEQRESLDKGKAWLNRTTPAATHQEKVFAAILALRSGKSRTEIQSQFDELFALQQPDGGWRQTPEMPSDAYATGQTLYVLSLAGFTAERPAIRRAVDFLVANQQPDGSWPMISRPNPGTGGKPAKLLTPITCAAGSWATTGLVRLVPKAKPNVANTKQ